MKKVEIESRSEEVAKVHDAILPAVLAGGYSEDAQFAIRLALDEALSNAIYHGNQLDPAKKVLVEYEIDDRGATVSVHDEGPGFTPTGVPDPTLDENLDKPHGRGIMLMRAYMSDVAFNELGNCVTLLKHRGCTRPW